MKRQTEAKNSAVRYEKQLVSRCVRGDKEAWDELVDKYKSLIYGAIIQAFQAAGYRNSEEATPDLFQEVFEKLFSNDYAKLRSFRWKNGCSLASWLHIVSKNIAFDYLRKYFLRDNLTVPLDRGGEEEAGIDYANLEGSVSDDLDEKEKIALFEKALDELPKEDIYLVDLIYFRGFSSEKAAEMTGKSVPAVYMQKKRVIEKLKKILSKQKRLP